MPTRSRATHVRSGFLGQSHSRILWRLEQGLGFDRRGGLFGLGDLGAAGEAGAVAEKLPDQTLLVAFSVGGGNHFQAHHWGAHRLTEHFLGPEGERGGGEGQRKRGNGVKSEVSGVLN